MKYHAQKASDLGTLREILYAHDNCDNEIALQQSLRDMMMAARFHIVALEKAQKAVQSTLVDRIAFPTTVSVDADAVDSVLELR